MEHGFRKIATCTAPLPARSKSPSSRTSCRNARRSRKNQYFWSYTIVITNSGGETVQLQTRHWIITDATGHQENIRGEGVIGEQPRARAGRALRIYQRRAAADRLGLHDRPLSDGERKRRAVRDRHPDILARQPGQQAGVELANDSASASAVEIVITGFDPVIHLSSEESLLRRLMDCRVKPGNDGLRKEVLPPTPRPPLLA